MYDKILDYYIKTNVIYLGFGSMYVNLLLRPALGVKEINLFYCIVFWIIWSIVIRYTIEKPELNEDE